MSAIHYREIESKEPLSDDEILSVLSKQVKQHKETIEASLSSRPELAAKEQAELPKPPKRQISDKNLPDIKQPRGSTP